MDVITQGLANLGFDWRVALASLANFLVVFYLLKRFLFANIEAAMEKRKKTIDEGLDNASKAKQELEGAREKREEILKDARTEANEILSTAHTQGDEVKERIEKKAEDAAEELKERTRDSLERERKEMEREVREKTAGMIVTSVEKILREEIDDKKSNDLIKKVTS